jgi:histone acetyltransferase (RNA polymerase elongator complex component)
MKRFVARRRRITRIRREIPAGEKSGRGKSRNLRDLILARAADKAWRCDCIRCREVALGELSARDKEDAFGYGRKGTQLLTASSSSVPTCMKGAVPRLPRPS